MLVRTALLTVLIVIAWFLFGAVRTAARTEFLDPSKTVLLFGGVVLFGAFVVVMAEFWLLPILGERIGNIFFGSNASFVRSPHAHAQALVARGDYVAAIEEYRRCYRKDPADALALMEMTHLQCDYLQDYGMAAELLEQALEREWPAEQAVTLAMRLADVYGKYLGQPARARQVLMQIAESMPDTRYALNAMHRVRELNDGLERLTDGPAGAYPVAPRAPDHASGEPARAPEESLGEPGEQDDQGEPVHGESEDA